MEASDASGFTFGGVAVTRTPPVIAAGPSHDLGPSRFASLVSVGI
jgi:hypothetical protein